MSVLIFLIMVVKDFGICLTGESSDYRVFDTAFEIQLGLLLIFWFDQQFKYSMYSFIFYYGIQFWKIFNKNEETDSIDDISRVAWSVKLQTTKEVWNRKTVDNRMRYRRGSNKGGLNITCGVDTIIISAGVIMDVISLFLPVMLP